MEKYEYEAECLRVVDGDTFDMRVDLGDFGFRLSGSTEQRFRLRGCNTPEVRGVERVHGEIAKSYVNLILSTESRWRIRTHKSDSFGRWIVDVFLDDPYWQACGGDDYTLTQRLIGEGYALPWDGRGRRPAFDPELPYPLPPDGDHHE